MGLLDSVLGAVMNQGQQPASGEAGATGLGGLMGMLASNPQLLQIATGMLGNDGEHGGLGGLVSKFEQAGLGGAINSWIGGGPNQPVSGEQITSALGAGTISDIAARLGVAPDQAAGQLSQMLPGLINHLTPDGQAPAQGLGNGGDLMGMLGGLLQKR
ncbi:YidB family protein [Polaromonas jejuensis]|uniref:YidB family protein n=1 Tax=Polaromonas jejuensis TaxID=457502 RepID=A0ABW0QEM7_9BURK|nr:YidB family protein [Polaromonas jejuensis]